MSPNRRFAASEELWNKAARSGAQGRNQSRSDRPKETWIMNSDQMEGKWKQLKGSVREKWGKLTDDDLEVIAGNKDKLLGKLQERYGITREEAEKQSDAWVKSAFAPDPPNARSARR
jgi:uncharacterized protein YjbJ (UPF0337 family)